jgi:T4 RnlA family RNA ligase
MNQYQQTLFDNLEALVKSNEAFYRQEFVLDGLHYFIYNYRLASYSDFLAPGALQCRGVMFEVDGTGQAIRIAALTQDKFFNYIENPFTMNLDLSTVVGIEDKADGSMMSTYIHNGGVRLKSKGSLFSEQAIDAMEWLNKPEQTYLKNWLLTLHSYHDHTVNLEWCSARMDHRIVIGHQKSHLLILNARCNTTGEFMSRNDLSRHDDVQLREYMIGVVDTNGLDFNTFVASIPGMTEDIEGYIVELASGLRFKCKTAKYLTAHRAKDSINSDRRLFEAVIDEAIDDVRSLFAHDALIMSRIDEMQTKVGHIYNHIVKSVEDFYEVNKSLDRKEYAIKGQAELGTYFGLGMNRYLQKPTDYKGFIKKQWKSFGVKDDDVVASV